jgi:hypothetical protein
MELFTAAWGTRGCQGATNLQELHVRGGRHKIQQAVDLLLAGIPRYSTLCE